MDFIAGIESKRIRAIAKQFENQGRDALLPMLHDLQRENGWLSRELQELAGSTLKVPFAEIHGVIEFYSMFYNEPTAKRVLRFCEDPVCHLRGANEVMKAVRSETGLSTGETRSDLSLTYEQVPCLGLCDQAPAMLIGDEAAANLKAENVINVLAGNVPESNARVYGNPRLITERVGVVDPQSLDDYLDHGGYETLKGLMSMTPDDVISLVEGTGILGRGGAMFPLGRKWRFTRESGGAEIEKYIVVNADESEPGTFKDRILMEEDPYAIIEAASLAGYAVGAKKGWIFVRGEYPKAYKRLLNAAAQCRENGFLGKNILDLGFDFDIELRLGAGAYICGEETSLFSAIEGYRGYPRIKPPFPVTNGLFGKPTAINNVETLAALLAVLRVGKGKWLKLGTQGSPGTKLFCLSGNVNNPGLYEMPFGITIQELIDLAGGIEGGGPAKAVLLGGAAGTFISPSSFDLPLTYEDARQRETPLGSGAVMVFNQAADLREAFYQLGRFFAHESCGKCFPCQLGTRRQLDILDQLAHGSEVNPSVKRDLIDIGFAMSETSLCGLGQTAAAAVMSGIEIWPELFE